MVFTIETRKNMNWMEEKNEQSLKMKIHHENTLHVPNNFVTWVEVNSCLREVLEEDTNPE